MGKLAIAGAVIGAVVVGGVGVGTKVADSKISAFYEHSEEMGLGNLKNIKILKKDLGITGGEVEWTADIRPDPCSANAIPIHGKDTIHKTFTGYEIDSKVKFSNPEIDKALESPLELQGKTTVNWLGNGHSDISVSDIRFDTNDLFFQVKPINYSLDFRRRDGNYEFGNSKLTIPEIAINDEQNNYFRIKKVSSKDNGFWNKHQFGDNQSFAKIDQIQMDIKGRQINIDDMQLHVDNVGKDTKRDIVMKYQIAKINVNSGMGSKSAENIQLNLSLLGVEDAALQKFWASIHQSSTECIPYSERKEQMKQSLISIFAKGFKLESKDNQIQLNGSSAKGSVEMDFPAVASHDQESAARELQAKTKLHTQMQMDKAFFRNMMQIGQPNVTEQEIESAWQKFVETTHGQLQGDKLVMDISR